MIPGSNLLAAALTVIGKQTVQYYQNTGKSVTNAIGMQVPVFSTPLPVQGSVQAVPRNKYEMFGLDFQKNYVIFYVPRCATDLQRNRAGDQFDYGCKKYQCVSETDWFAMDGWTGVLSVEISC